MGLSLIFSIAGLAWAAIKSWRYIKESGEADNVTQTVRHTTGVVINLANGIRALLDALNMIAPRPVEPAVASPLSAAPTLRIGRRVADEMSPN